MMTAAGRCWLLLCLLCATALAGMAAEWQGRTVVGVRIFTPPGQTRTAAHMERLVRRELPRLQAALGVERVAPLDLYAYTNRAAFLRDARPEPFTLGLSFSPSGMILLDASDLSRRLQQTVAHELSHSLITQRLAGQDAALPDWVNEGIAGHFSEPVSRAALPRVARMMHRDGPLWVDELEVAFRSSEYRDAGYLQSRSMVAWLEYHHPGSIPVLLAHIADGQTFPEALRAVTGLTPEQWVLEWARSVPPYLFWLSLLASPVVYAPLAIILIILFWLRARKNSADDEEIVNILPGDGDNKVEEFFGLDALPLVTPESTPSSSGHSAHPQVPVERDSRNDHD